MEEADPVEFTKMHGLGNDFILVEDLDAALPEDQCPSLAQQLCHRRTGIGGDGLMFIRRGEQAPVRMRLYNSDGSLADMCGNGIRCFARYVYDHKIQTATRFPIETDAGIKEASLTLTDGQVSAVEISMGTPAFARPQIPMLGGEGDCRLSAIEALGSFPTCSAVNTGVPHLVFLEEALPESDLLRYGPALETPSPVPQADQRELHPGAGRKYPGGAHLGTGLRPYPGLRHRLLRRRRMRRRCRLYPPQRPGAPGPGQPGHTLGGGWEHLYGRPRRV